MTSKTTFEITKLYDMLCRQGPSERYAPLGLSFPPLPRRAPPIHEAMGGYAAPKAPAGQSCLDGEYFNAWPCQYDIDLNRINDKWYLGKLRYNSTDRTALTRHVNTEKLSCLARMGKSPLIFDPLGNGSPVLHIDNQKVSRLNECQEAGS